MTVSLLMTIGRSGNLMVPPVRVTEVLSGARVRSRNDPAAGTGWIGDTGGRPGPIPSGTPLTTVLGLGVNEIARIAGGDGGGSPLKKEQ